MGDAMLCWFGAPVPQPDHAERAVAACTAIMERLHVWNVERTDQGLGLVGTGIGIACGEVVVGNIGSSQRLEYTAIGDAVNLSSRLCSHAEAGEVVATDAVRQAVPDAPFERIGPIQVKGVKEPVLVHKITFE
jgi:adenylate cyclase